MQLGRVLAGRWRREKKKPREVEIVRLFVRSVGRQVGLAGEWVAGTRVRAWKKQILAFSKKKTTCESVR